MLLIAPSSQHRVLFRCGDKRYVVRMANRYAIAGFACVALAMAGALFFVANTVLGGGIAALAGGGALTGALWCWYLQPLRRRLSLFRHRPPLGARAERPTAFSSRAAFED